MLFLLFQTSGSCFTHFAFLSRSPFHQNITFSLSICKLCCSELTNSRSWRKWLANSIISHCNVPKESTLLADDMVKHTQENHTNPSYILLLPLFLFLLLLLLLLFLLLFLLPFLLPLDSRNLCKFSKYSSARIYSQPFSPILILVPALNTNRPIGPDSCKLAT